MEYQYWGENTGRSPARKEVERAFKNDNLGKKAVKLHLRTFGNLTYDQMVPRAIVPFHDSPAKIPEWKFNVRDKTARMFFVVFQNCAWFVHFIVKKSTKGGKTPPDARETAERRGAICRAELESNP